MNNNIYDCTNVINNLIAAPQGIEEMPNMALHPYTNNIDKVNALRKLFNILIGGSIDEILEFDTESVEPNSKYGIAKMLRLMIEHMHDANNRRVGLLEETEDIKLYYWKVNVEYVHACRKVALYIISTYCHPYEEYKYIDELPTIIDYILYILKIWWDWGDIDIFIENIRLLKDIEVLVCNNIDLYEEVMKKLSELSSEDD